MKATYRFITLLVIALFIPHIVAKAQGRSLPILETNPDARTVAMGNVSMVNTDRMYLYTNPTSFLYGDESLTMSASTEIYPSQDELGRQMFYNASAGYRFLERHAVYAGFRYLGGLSIPKVNNLGEETKNNMTPFDWTIDLGYGFRLNDQFAFFGTGSFIQSYVTRVAYAGSFTLGGNYRHELDWGVKPSLLNVGLRVADFGMPLTYSSSSSYALPTSVSLGSDLSYNLAEDHNLTFALGGRYYFLPTDAQLLQLGAGLEYNLMKIVSLRAGYEYGQKGMSHLTAGLGLSYAGFKFDFAYRHSSSEFAVNTMILSATYNIHF